MRTWRSWFPILSLASGLSAAGCTDHGSYSVKWTFIGDERESRGNADLGEIDIGDRLEQLRV